MKAEDLKNLVNDYNSQVPQKLNSIADHIITQSQENIKCFYEEGKGYIMEGVKKFSVVIEHISEDLREFSTYIDWILYDADTTLQEEYGDAIRPFLQVILTEDLKDLKVAGFCGEDIRVLFPLASILQERGFNVYIDEPDNTLLLEVVM